MDRALTTALAVLLVGCTSQSTSTGSPPPSVRRVVPFTRSCDSAVLGRPDTRHAVRIGPLALIGTDQRLGRSMFEEHHGRYAAIKVLAVVAGPRDVTVTVPLTHRDSVFLLYDPAADANRWGFRIAETDAQVRFEACPGRDPQYNGGFLLTEGRCVELDVATSRSDLVSASFPMGDRASC